MAAEVRPKRRSRAARREKKNALLAEALAKGSDASSDAGSEASSTSRASAQSVVSAPAVYDECKEKDLCYRFQRGARKKDNTCAFKHERCSTPLPDGWKTDKGKCNRGADCPYKH